jgi:hypothetical protein
MAALQSPPGADTTVATQTSRPAHGLIHAPGMDVIRRAMAFFIPLAVLATLGCGLIGLEVQQSLRSDANDPQFQLAEDAATRLDAGSTPAFVVDRTAAVDVATSLAPFTIVFDSQHKVLAANGRLDGGIPVPPAGMLDAAGSGSPNAITWQPRDGVRIATVTVAWSGGFVLVGRSLTRVEQQESTAELLAGASLPAILVLLALASLVSAWVWPSGRTAGTAS